MSPVLTPKGETKAVSSHTVVCNEGDEIRFDLLKEDGIETTLSGYKELVAALEAFRARPAKSRRNELLYQRMAQIVGIWAKLCPWMKEAYIAPDEGEDGRRSATVVIALSEEDITTERHWHCSHFGLMLTNLFGMCVEVCVVAGEVVPSAGYVIAHAK